MLLSLPSPKRKSWLSSLPLRFGAADQLLVRHETVTTFGLPHRFRLLYASDLHLGLPWTNVVCRQIESAADEVCADCILLGGDLVETRAALAIVAEHVQRLSRLAPVYCVSGNHDLRVGLPALRDAVARSGIWLDDSSVEIDVAGARIQLHGAKINRQPVAERSILCAHNPAIFPLAADAGCQLVLAGHLHGGQCVLATHQQRLFPGACFNRWTGLRFERGASTLIVSRGAADTLPVRWNCPREVVVCDLH